MMNRTALFNNAGVRCFEMGRHQMAWVLFKGALESRRLTEIEGASPDQRERYNMETTRHYIDRAERAYFDLVAVEVESHGPAESGNAHVALTSGPSDVASSDQFRTQELLSESIRGHSSSNDLAGSTDLPFLYTRPMLLEDSNDDNEDDINRNEINNNNSGSTHIGCSRSAAIIFNLALLDHVSHRSCRKVLKLYNLALSLLCGMPADNLSAALVNNVGVWHYENGDVDGASFCMGLLSSFLQTSLSMDDEDRRGLLSNVHWLIHPPHTASPAA